MSTDLTTIEANFEMDQRRATAMAHLSFLPKHLRGKNINETAANCLMIQRQAARWSMDEFQVASQTYVVPGTGRLAYQGLIVHAVINKNLTNGGGKRLRPTYHGKGDDLTITLTGKFGDEDEERSVSLTVRQGKAQSPTYKSKPKDSMWTVDPEQKLVYSGALRWARRHAPELVMGVLIEEEGGIYEEGDPKKRVALEPVISVIEPGKVTVDEEGNELTITEDGEIIDPPEENEPADTPVASAPSDPNSPETAALPPESGPVPAGDDEGRVPDELFDKGSPAPS